MGLFDGDGIDGLDDSDYVVDEEIDDDDEEHELSSDNHISAQPPLPSIIPRVDAVTLPVQTTISKTLPAKLRAKGITYMVIKKKNGKEYIFS